VWLLTLVLVKTTVWEILGDSTQSERDDLYQSPKRWVNNYEQVLAVELHVRLNGHERSVALVGATVDPVTVLEEMVIEHVVLAELLGTVELTLMTKI